MTNRRQFLLAAGSALASASTVAAVRPKPLSLLFLGGTGAIGPYHVRAAVARGHHVAVFSRGQTAADLPPGVERLVGDRNGPLDAIARREWDAVIDIATFGPGW